MKSLGNVLNAAELFILKVIKMANAISILLPKKELGRNSAGCLVTYLRHGLESTQRDLQADAN